MASPICMPSPASKALLTSSSPSVPLDSSFIAASIPHTSDASFGHLELKIFPRPARMRLWTLDGHALRSVFRHEHRRLCRTASTAYVLERFVDGATQVSETTSETMTSLIAATDDIETTGRARRTTAAHIVFWSIVGLKAAHWTLSPRLDR
jgi:hypothetical protein